MSTSSVNQTFPLFPTSVMMHHAVYLADYCEGIDATSS